MSGIVVVDRAEDERVVVWRLSVGDGLESTMAGAWVLPPEDQRIPGLLVGAVLVTTERAAGRYGVGADATALAGAVDDEVAALDAAFSRHLDGLPSSRRALVRLRWPRLPMALTRKTAGDPVASDALSLARWVSELLVAWGKVEAERLARAFLPGGVTAREFPVGWPQAVTA